MITVFTPTYNRGYIIKQLYNSLILQSYKDFEWLVIDDGILSQGKYFFIVDSDDYLHNNALERIH